MYIASFPPPLPQRLGTSYPTAYSSEFNFFFIIIIDILFWRNLRES